MVTFPQKLSSSIADRSGVGVGRADHAKLVRIDAELLFQFQAIAQSAASILEFEHLWLFLFGKVEIRFVPALVVRKLIVGREERVCLPVALNLRDLINAFAERACLGIFSVDRFASERLDEWETSGHY